MEPGIEAIAVYPGRASLSVERLFEARGLSMSRFDNLMMERKSVNLPCEDPVTNAVNAAKPIVDGLSDDKRESIELLVVGTESGLDFGKPISTYVHRHLGLSERCRSFEVKHACYGGTAALRSALGIVADSGRASAKALVVAADASTLPDKDTYWEPSQGAGAVAMLVGSAPTVLQPDRGAAGYHTYEVQDTARPLPDQEVGDSDLSLLSYLRCLQATYGMYAERVTGVDLMSTFDYLVLHTPFAGMVKGAHRTLVRQVARDLGPDAIIADFRRRVEPTLAFCRQVGNIYSAALYLALASLLEHGSFNRPRRIGLFSYGSGCASEFYSGVVRPEAATAFRAQGLAELIESRMDLEMEPYEVISKMSADRLSGVRDADFPVDAYEEVYVPMFEGRDLLVLEGIREFHRSYRWS